LIELCRRHAIPGGNYSCFWLKNSSAFFFAHDEWRISIETINSAFRACICLVKARVIFKSFH